MPFAQKKLRTLIVDDEPLALNLLRSYLSRRHNIEIVSECNNGKEAIEAINSLQPDLVFLDIQMPGLTGFDVVEKIPKEIMPMVVFATAYDQYAINAFDVHAVDYLLKPLDEDLLVRAISRCFERQASELAKDNDQLRNAVAKIRHQMASDSNNGVGHSAVLDTSAIMDETRSKLIIRDRGAITFVEQQDVDWVDAAGDYMCVHVAGETHIIRSTLKNLIEQLDPVIFERVHRSTIVNLERIQKVIPLPKSEYFIELNCGEKLKVSRNYKDVIKALILKHEENSK